MPDGDYIHGRRGTSEVAVECEGDIFVLLLEILRGTIVNRTNTVSKNG